MPGKNLDLTTDLIPLCSKQLLHTHSVLGGKVECDHLSFQEPEEAMTVRVC